MTPSAVLFDLFDTLVLLDRSRLPEVHVNGKTRRTTAGHLHRAFQPYAPGLSLEDFVDALFWSWQEAERLRAVEIMGARHATRQMTRAQFANLATIPLIFVGGGIGYAIRSAAGVGRERPWPTSSRQCGHRIGALENIPVLSYLFLRGHCLACNAPISARYPMVELITAALTVAGGCSDAA